MTLPSALVYRLGDTEVRPAQGVVLRAGQEIYLRPKTFQVLTYLLENHQRLVTKEELMETVWRDTAVTDDALVQSITDIRKAFGDNPHNPRFIRTFPRVGYRFVGPVEEYFPQIQEIREEVTTFEAEYEEEVSDEVLTCAVQSKEFATPSPVVGIPKIWKALALSVLVVGVGLGIHAWRQSLQNKSAAELALVQVPGRKAIAVMYLENHSGTRELDWLRAGLADMLITDLSRSAKFHVLSRQQLSLLLERTGFEHGEVIDLSRALDIGRRIRADAVLLGSYGVLGKSLRMDVQLHDAHTGQLILAEGLTVERPELILNRIGVLSLKIGGRLGLAPQDDTPRTGDYEAVTDNLEAYRYYSLAMERLRGIQVNDGIALLKRAIEKDPGFAMAYGRLGYAFAMIGTQADEAKPYLEKAFQLSSRLTPKDRLSIAAWYAVANLDYESAINAYREILKIYPLEVEAYFRLGRLLSGEGSLEEALSTLEAGAVVDPESTEILIEMKSILSLLGRHEDAIATMQRCVALKPREPNIFDSLGLAYHCAGRFEQAIDAYRRAIERDPRFEVAVIHLGNTYFQVGRYREALREFENYLKLAPSVGERGRGYGSLAWTLWCMGNRSKAEEAAILELRTASIAGAAILIALEKGEIEQAVRLAESYKKKTGTDRGTRPPSRQYYYQLGRIALATGRSEEAITHFRAALRQRPLYWNLESLEDCLANAFLKLGRFDEAIEEYRRVLRLYPNFPRVHYQLGLALRRKGDLAAARVEITRFLQLWEGADSDAPQLLDARSQLQQINFP